MKKTVVTVGPLEDFHEATVQAHITFDQDKLKWVGTLVSGQIFRAPDLQSLYNEIFLALGIKVKVRPLLLLMTMELEEKSKGDGHHGDQQD